MNTQENNEDSSDKKPTIFLQGKKCYLRPLGEEGDAERNYLWINDPETNVFLQTPWPMSILVEREWTNNSSSKKDRSGFSLAIITNEGVHIGNMGVDKIDWVNGTATTGAMIGDKAYLGKGYGSDAKMALLNYLFNTLNLRKICSSVIAFNKRSVNYSLRCGYKKEGVLKKHFFRKGRYWDVVQLAVFKEDWLPLWEEYKASLKKGKKKK